MTLLIVLTLIYVAVLVLALAASLVAVLTFLLRIRSALGQTADALREARDRTAALRSDLDLFEDSANECEEAFERAQENLRKIDERLGRVWPPAEEAAIAR